jgi:2',3'-cyclic-nucleotide 2'-phosphodiesterase (5'-nucleotidase family)
MKLGKKFFSYTLSLCLLISSISSFNTLSVYAADTITIDIVLVNDFHGAVEDNGQSHVGAANLVNELLIMQENNPNTIILAGGDNFNGPAISNLLYGAPVVTMFNHANINYSAIGNHEFNWGFEPMEMWIENGLTLLAANIWDTTTDELFHLAQPYTIIQVGGVNVGILGLATPQTYFTTHPSNIANLEFLDPLETTEKWVPIIRDAGADLVILLTHIGGSQDEYGVITFESESYNLGSVQGVDGILLGHSHRNISGFYNGIPVIEALSSGRAIGKISFVLDANTKEVISATPSIDILYERRDTLSPHEQTALDMAAYSQLVSPILNEVIGYTAIPMTRSSNRTSITGQWVAELIMADYENSQIAFTNSGGIRAELEAGPITTADMYEVIPFNNFVAHYEMTGAQVVEVIEHGISSRGFVQSAGIIVEYNPYNEPGSKVYSVTLANGDALDMYATYIVSTNDFMGEGGDGFTTFLDATLLSETSLVRDLLINDVRSHEVFHFTPQIEQPFVAIDNSDTMVYTPIDIEYNYNYALQEEPLGEYAIHAQNTHVVVSGDNLTRIAYTFNTNWQTLQQLNNLSNPHLIFPGDVLIVPSI